MNPAHTCPRCGVQLAPGTPPEKCPRCLLGLAVALDDDADAYSVAAAAGRPPVPTPEELAPGFPQLEILDVLGQGGMGVVYRARQKGLDREVALKVLHVDDNAGPEFAERFAREARALASLTHSNIVAVHDSGVTDGRFWLLMEHVDGTDLRGLIRSGNLAPSEALNLVSQLCDALNYAHEQGVVHRDIKPENILVDRKGRVKVADFGLAKLLRRAPEASTLTRPEQALGTYHYMAPEQIERPLEVDHRADIFSMGVVFYELLTGELPLGRFGLPSEKVGVDVRLDEVVLRALEKEPRRRYQHASEIKTRVDAIREQAPSEPEAPAAAAPAAPPTGHREPRRSSLGLILGVGCLVFLFLTVGGALGVAFLSGSHATQAPAVQEAELRTMIADALKQIRARASRGELTSGEVVELATLIVMFDRGAQGAAVFQELVESALKSFKTSARAALGEKLRAQADRLDPSPEREAVFAALAKYER